MRTPKELYRISPTIYPCELETCLMCHALLSEVSYLNGLKTVQTLTEVQTVAYRPKVCVTEACSARDRPWPSAAWQQVAPKYSTYGYDVIAQIGWERQHGRATFEGIHANLAQRVKISESYVRYMYHQKYLPLLACHERQHLTELSALSRSSGLLLGLDGLMAEGGEPQLWVVRELQTGWTLRCGWLSCEDQTTFTAFLQPLADLHLAVKAVMSDKQRAVLLAVAEVFPEARHGFCQSHYFKNAATPVSEADEQMKIALRQQVRATVGGLIRQKEAEKSAVLTVTGLVPSSVAPSKGGDPQPRRSVSSKVQREAIVQDLLQRVRYLLTLKGRPPFRLAGLEMFGRLQEVVRCLDRLLRHHPEPRLEQLRRGLRQSLQTVRADSRDIQQAATWLAQVATVLDPDLQPARSGKQVREEWQACLDQMKQEAAADSRLAKWSAVIERVSESYAPGLFNTYDIPGLPRTNNERESEFRNLRRRLLATTGQTGAVKRILLRSGAWELIPGLGSLSETVQALSQVEPEALRQERERVQTHQARFRLHTRSVKRSEAQLQKLIRRWKALPAANGP